MKEASPVFQSKINKSFKIDVIKNFKSDLHLNNSELYSKHVLFFYNIFPLRKYDENMSYYPLHLDGAGIIFPSINIIQRLGSDWHFFSDHAKELLQVPKEVGESSSRSFQIHPVPNWSKEQRVWWE